MDMTSLTSLGIKNGHTALIFFRWGLFLHTSFSVGSLSPVLGGFSLSGAVQASSAVFQRKPVQRSQRYCSHGPEGHPRSAVLSRAVRVNCEADKIPQCWNQCQPTTLRLSTGQMASGRPARPRVVHRFAALPKQWTPMGLPNFKTHLRPSAPSLPEGR